MFARANVMLLAVGVIAVAIVLIVTVFRAGTFRLSLDELRSQYSRSTTQFMDIRGLSIHLEDEGEGPVVLLIHGSFGSLRTWDVMVENFKHKYRFVRFDLPAYGLSAIPLPGDDAAGITLTEIIEGILGRLGIEELSIVGTSSGGSVGYWYAALHPDQVEKIAFLNTPSDPVRILRSARPPPVRWYMRLCDDILNFRIPAFWRVYYTYLWGEPERLQESLLEEYYDMNRRVASYVPRQFIPSNPNREEVLKMTSSIRIPSLLIWGMRDPVLPPPALDSLRGKLENSPKTVVELPTVGHYPMSEAPEEVSRLVDIFLSEPSQLDQ